MIRSWFAFSQATPARQNRSSHAARRNSYTTVMSAADRLAARALRSGIAGASSSDRTSDHSARDERMTDAHSPSIRRVTATRYVTPLREGGSLPAIVEADDDGLYVLKFRGAGQGRKALIAELVTGEIARALGLRVPEIVFVDLDAALGRSEPDEEIQALITASAGLNLGLDYLPGSLAFDPLVAPPEPRLASEIVWLDAYTTNVDRTARNTNMLLWHRTLWLIDHGASLYFHHTWRDYATRSRAPMPQIREHVLLPYAAALTEVDQELAARLTPERLTAIIDLIPDAWLGDEATFMSHEQHRAAYVEYLVSRVQSPRAFVEEAIDARARLV
jgi:hypothetical protein